MIRFIFLLLFASVLAITLADEREDLVDCENTPDDTACADHEECPIEADEVEARSGKKRGGRRGGSKRSSKSTSRGGSHSISRGSGSKRHGSSHSRGSKHSTAKSHSGGPRRKNTGQSGPRRRNTGNKSNNKNKRRKHTRSKPRQRDKKRRKVDKNSVASKKKKNLKNKKKDFLNKNKKRDRSFFKNTLPNFVKDQFNNLKDAVGKACSTDGETHGIGSCIAGQMRSAIGTMWDVWNDDNNILAAMVKPLIKDYLYNEAQEKLCSCSSGIDCMCCIDLPGFEIACLDLIICPNAQSAVVKMTYGNKTEAAITIPDDEEKACASPGMFKIAETCIMGEETTELDDGFTVCWTVESDLFDEKRKMCIEYTNGKATFK